MSLIAIKVYFRTYHATVRNQRGLPGGAKTYRADIEKPEMQKGARKKDSRAHVVRRCPWFAISIWFDARCYTVRESKRFCLRQELARTRADIEMKKRSRKDSRAQRQVIEGKTRTESATHRLMSRSKVRGEILLLNWYIQQYGWIYCYGPKEWKACAAGWFAELSNWWPQSLHQKRAEKNKRHGRNVS